MKRIAFLVLCIAGSTVLSSGQTVTPLGQAAAPGQQVFANRIEMTGAQSWHLRGGVQIVNAATTITADEVDATTGPNGTVELDLRGNVHVTMNQTR